MINTFCSHIHLDSRLVFLHSEHKIIALAQKHNQKNKFHRKIKKNKLKKNTRINSILLEYFLIVVSIYLFIYSS